MTPRRVISLLPLLLVALGVALGLGPVGAQGPLGPGSQFTLPSTTVGSLNVTQSNWNFDGDLAGGGPWAELVVSNSGCGVLVQPGTAQAWLIFWTAQLQDTGTQSGATVYQGDILSPTGAATGHARVTVSPGPNPSTHVDATMWNVSSDFFGSTFSVCIGPLTLVQTATLIDADVQEAAAQGYRMFDVATALGPDGSTLVAVAGSSTSDTLAAWVFFFDGTTYLGTDTATPSTQILGLSSGPATNQISVQYADYAPNDRPCCPSLPPVTITYTWDGSTVMPNGTPPGHEPV